MDGTKQAFVDEADVNNFTLEIPSNYEGSSFSLADFNKTNPQKAYNIRANQVNKSVSLYGDDRPNVICASTGGSDIYAGKDDDVIYDGKGKDDINYNKKQL